MKYNEYLDSPIFWLRRAALALRKAHDEEMHAHDLSNAQFEVLRHLWERDGLEQRQLQDRLGVSSPTLTGIVDGLAARGLLERRLSSDDARVKLLFLTAAGRAMECQVEAAMVRVQSRLLAGFSASESALMHDWLRRIAQNMGVSGDTCE
jgi:DNA-binding MarR family transcriptional regulator